MENENKPIEFAKLYNTTKEDFTFYWDKAPYTIRANESKDFINYIAEHGAKKMADKYSKTANKEEKMVLRQAFLQNVPIGEMAERMGVNLNKIRQEVLNKEKERARVVNLEAEVMAMREQMKAILNQKEAKSEIKVESDEKIDKRTKEYKALKAQEAEGIQS